MLAAAAAFTPDDQDFATNERNLLEAQMAFEAGESTFPTQSEKVQLRVYVLLGADTESWPLSAHEPQQLLRDLWECAEDNNSLLYVSHIHNIFHAPDNLYVLGSTLYQRQVKFLKLLRFVAQQVNLTKTSQKTSEALTYIINAGLMRLGSNSWLRSSREVLE